MSRMVSTVVLLIVVIVVGILFYRVMIGFFVPLFLAALLVVIFRPVHTWIGLRLGGRPRTAALATTASILLVVLIPALLVISVAAAQGTTLLSRVNYNSMSLALQRTRHQLGLEIPHIDPFRRLPDIVQSLGAVETPLTDGEVRAARDRFRELERSLQTLREDHAPLTERQSAIFAATRDALEQLEQDFAVLVAETKRREADGQEVAFPDADAAPADAGTEIDSDTGIDADTAADADAFADVDPGADIDAATQPDHDAETVTPVIDYRSPEERYQRTLVRLDDRSRELTAALLGGTLTAQLKLWANPTDEDIARWISQGQIYLQSRLLRMTSATGEFLIQTLIGLVILIITVYFFLVDGPGMVRTLMRLSPLDDRYERELLTEFDRISRAVVLATVLSALAQGILATVGYYFAGLGAIVLLFLVTTFMALIPFLGAASVWIPCALWLGFVEQRWTAAIILAIYGAVVVSSIDNFIKVFVLHGRSQLHPLLALLSVLGGVQVFGPIGILVGPMIVVFLQTTLEILNQELNHLAPPSPESDAPLATDVAVTETPDV